MKKIKNQEKVEEIAEKIQTMVDRKHTYDKYEYFELMEKLYTKIDKYELEPSVQKDVKKGIKIARKGKKVLHRVSLGMLKIKKIKDKAKKIKDKFGGKKA